VGYVPDRPNATTPVPERLGRDTIRRIYHERFAQHGLDNRHRVWKVICEEVLQPFVPQESCVLDVGAGYGEFIDNIVARQRLALDPNSDVGKSADGHVQRLVADAQAIPLADGVVDVAFASNVFEHMPSREAILGSLEEVRRVLRPGGTLLVIQPNVRYLFHKYWDFFDHRIPLSDKSMREALSTVGFRIERCQAKFLPYSFDSRLPTASFLVRWYLRLSVAQRLLGKQMFLVARAP
jgi:ubiquinone/menaquinone biosynthesis C-methylase UbiE